MAPFTENALLDASRVAAHAAADVDRDARFPFEAIAAMREACLLSLPVPTEHGGPGASLAEVARVLQVMSGADASVGVILLMHYTQVLIVARHAETEELAGFLREVHERQLLIASCNSELSVPGNQRMSRCALIPDDDDYRLAKQTPVMSFGEYADAALVTARRAEDAAEGDQVLALARASDLALTPLGPWDAMGLRGTCSRPFDVQARVRRGMVIEDFRHVVDFTGLPMTNLLYAASWVGMAEAAVDVARGFVRRRHSGDGEAAALARVRLAEIMLLLDQLTGLRLAAESAFDSVEGTEDVTSWQFIGQLQTLKVAGSQLLLRITLAALDLCGVAGYRNDSPDSLGRAVRDALGATVMVSNDSILSQNGQIALLRR